MFPQLAQTDQEKFELLARVSRVINRKINSGMDYRIILDDVFDFLDMLIPFDRIGIALIETEGAEVALNWVKSKIGVRFLPIGYRKALRGTSLERVARCRKPRIIKDLRDYIENNPKSDSSQAIFNDGIHSSLTFPLSAEGEVIGFVFFSSKNTHTYSSSHIELFSTIIDEMSMLVRYGQLSCFHQKHKSCDQLTRTIVHELRAPLCIIQAYLEHATTERWYQELEGKGDAFFEVIRRNTGLMFRLITELADVLKSNAANDSLDIQDVPLMQFCIEVENSGQLLAAGKNINFKCSIDSDLPEYWRFDPNRIRQVLNNLLTNAVKFSYPDSQITFHVYRNANRLFFEVQDTGQGIPETELPKLFREFGKTSVRPTAGEPSTGLGLAIAQRIVEAHNGKIGVKSKVSHGSSFTFFIPHAAKTPKT